MNRDNSDDFSMLMLVFEDREAYKIKTLHDMANVLLNLWPDEEGDAYVIAVKACLDAKFGDVSPEFARRALIKAAEEAGLGVITIIH
ncbi:hypothetical protein FHX14_005410 [Rhizobium sp. BK619]|uniref:DUF982 domain-containing protein n=1 Tax=Rhizobium sp. BK619 TaxID=2586989 RepID=UPI00161581D9|nr:DUF982 domain-containing protein [Rhizobium sp. BK619]MBB3649176.1 hypothetical protein [Rhizobium sp. BK619]